MAESMNPGNGSLAPLYDGGFMVRDVQGAATGFASVRGEPGGVVLSQSIYGTTAFSTANLIQRLSPDEAIELAGALEQAAKAVWAHHSGLQEEN